MHFAVLANESSWYARDLERAAEGKHRITSVTFNRLVSSLRNPDFAVSSGEVDLAACDAVLVRTMPPGSLEQVVFRMDVLGQLEARGQLVVNPPRSIEAAVDKYLASAKLQAAGLRVPRTFICQTTEEALAAFEQLGGDVVVKPLFGAEGRGIARINDEALAQRAFRLLEDLRAVLYVQEFIPHEGCDLRVFLLDDQAFAMRRSNPTDWRTNVSRGARAEAIPLEPVILHVAQQAAQAVGAIIAGVDLLPGRDGQLYVLEVNAVPGWKALAAACQIDIAALLLDHVAKLVSRRR